MVSPSDSSKLISTGSNTSPRSPTPPTTPVPVPVPVPAPLPQSTIQYIPLSGRATFHIIPATKPSDRSTIHYPPGNSTLLLHSVPPLVVSETNRLVKPSKPSPPSTSPSDQHIRVLTPSEIMRTLPSLNQETYDTSPSTVSHHATLHAILFFNIIYIFFLVIFYLDYPLFP